MAGIKYHMLNQNTLNGYFDTVWRHNAYNSWHYKYTGEALLDQIRVGEYILDVGCGTNHFKPLLSNLTGVDPVFEQADYRMTLEQFTVAHNAQKFNVAFALESINYGTIEDIEMQTYRMVRFMRQRDSRIYWRCNPGLQEDCPVPVFAWTFDEQVRLATKYDYTILEMEWDENGRFYSFWNSNNSLTPGVPS